MTREAVAATLLMALAVPSVASAQDWNWKGDGLSAAGVFVHGYSFGAQSTPEGIAVIEHPLVLRRTFDQDSLLVLALLSRSDALASSALKHRTNLSRAVLELVGARVQSYAVSTRQVGVDFLVQEHVNVRAASLTPAVSKESSSPSGNAAAPAYAYRSLTLGGGVFDSLSATSRNASPASVAFGVERPVTAGNTLSPGFRALPLVMTFLGTGTDAEQAYFSQAVRRRTLHPLLTIKMNPTTNSRQPTPPWEWQFHDAVVTSSTYGVDGTVVSEQVSVTYKKLVIVTSGTQRTFTMNQ